MFNPLSDKRTDKRAASVLALLGLLCTLLFVPAGPAAAAPGDNVTQNWPAAAVFYEAPCPDTPTFSMTEEAFLACKTALESRVVLAYSQLLAALPAGQRLALEQPVRVCQVLFQRGCGAKRFAFLGQRRRQGIQRVSSGCDDEHRPVLAAGWRKRAICQRAACL